MGIDLTPDELFEVFGDEDPTIHGDEAEQRWGDTDAWRQSQRRTSRYGKTEWLTITHQTHDIDAQFVAALQAGQPPTSPAAMDIAEAHRQHIDRWFYDCPPEMHRTLGELYVGDPRFTAHYDEQAPGLARYVREAVTANAGRSQDEG